MMVLDADSKTAPLLLRAVGEAITAAHNGATSLPGAMVGRALGFRSSMFCASRCFSSALAEGVEAATTSSIFSLLSALASSLRSTLEPISAELFAPPSGAPAADAVLPAANFPAWAVDIVTTGVTAGGKELSVVTATKGALAAAFSDCCWLITSAS